MRLTFSSTPKLNFEPWTALKPYCPDLQVQEYALGCFFLASGCMRPETLLNAANIRDFYD